MATVQEQAAAGPAPEADALVQAYASAAGSGDVLRESFARGERVWDAALAGVAALGQGDLGRAAERVRAQAHELGTAYRLPGDAEDRPWPLSPVPLVLGARDWQAVAAGVAQRAELMERLLADVYGARRLFAEGRLPAAAITGSPDFQRGMIGVAPPSGHRLHIYACDLARGPDGGWRVLADHARAPAGAGYALENRLAIGRALGDGLHLPVQRLAPFFEAFRRGLARGAKRADPRIALLTPGRFNPSYPEQAHLARSMGLLLVEGSDLAVHDDMLFVRTVAGLKRVDAVWRRMDGRWLDPLAFDSRSQIGVPGLMDGMAAGNATIANAPGTGLCEARALSPFLPALCRRLLNTDLALPGIATWWCGQPAELATVEARLDSMVIAPAFAAAAGLDGDRPVLGAALEPEARAALLADMRRRPTDYVGQEVVRLSTMPAVVAGALVPRPFTVRVFAARDGEGRWQVMPGGFCRLGENADVRAAVMGEGVHSADVMVVADAADDARAVDAAPVAIRRHPGTLPSRAADDLYWLGRYLERGEAHLRLVRGVLGGAIDADGGAALGQSTLARLGEMLVAAGAARPGMPDLQQAAHDALDGTEPPAGVRRLLGHVRTIGEGMRDRLSAEVWRLLDPVPAPLGPSDAASMLARAGELGERFAALAGLAAENMMRGDGWRFHDLGRRVERAATLCRHARALAADGAGPDDLLTLLDLADSQISARARYPDGAGLLAVRDLLLLDPANPRGLAFQVERIAEHLRALPALRDDGLAEAQQAQSAQLLAALAFAAPETIAGDALLGLENRLYALSDAIAARYFLQGGELVRSTADIRLA